MRTAAESAAPFAKRGLRASVGLTCALSLFAFGFASSVLAQAAPPASSAAAPPAANPPQTDNDPVSELIALSTSHFEAGQRELREGHLETAKAEFNRSLEVLLESRYGGRTEPRIREHFDRLVERISAYEMTALAQGDGFTEKKYEPATIDDLLAISTFEQPPATHRNEGGRLCRSAGDPSRHRHPAERQGAAVRAAVQRSAEGLPRGRPEPRRPVSADDPGGLPGRRPAAGSGLCAAD